MENDDDCEHCNLDRVMWSDVLPCMYKSCVGIWRDLVIHQKTDVIGVFSRDDRVLYIVGIVLIALTIQILLAR